MFSLNGMKSTYLEVRNILGAPPDCIWTITLSATILWDWFRKQQNINIPFFLQEHSNPLSMHLKKTYKVRAAIRMAKDVPVCIVAHRQLSEFKNLSNSFNCNLIWNTVNPLFLKKSLNKPRRNSLLFVGRLSEEKGLIRLIRAVNIIKDRVPDIHLKIIGSGKEENNLKKLKDLLDLDNHIDFHGPDNYLEIANSLEKSEVFILPSFYENCPVSLLEAQVKGVPCLITENGGSEKVLLQGNGIVVKDDGSGNQIAEGIQNLFSNLKNFNREEIRERSIKEFAPEIFAEKFYGLLNEVMN
jgi:glycosyltransferase involved in cell wall biosynthesis